VKLDLVEAQLEAVETLLIIFSEHSVERKKTSSGQQQKSSIQKVSITLPLAGIVIP